MASGRLLVCWDNVAYRQMLGDESAFFVPQSDVHALAAAFGYIACNKSEAVTRADSGRVLSKSFGFEQHMISFASAVSHSLHEETQQRVQC
jgi:hypothetical protein